MNEKFVSQSQANYFYYKKNQACKKDKKGEECKKWSKMAKEFSDKTDFSTLPDKKTNEQKDDKEVQPKYEYGCLMLQLPFTKWNDVINIVKEEDVYNNKENEYGIEDEPHCTVLYGFHSDVNVAEIQEKIESIGDEFTVFIEGISNFTNEEYDVLKFDVSSPMLKELNKQMKEYPHTTSFPNYNPHITISYLKKGEGVKYNKKFDKPIEVSSSLFKFSEPSGDKHYFKSNELREDGLNYNDSNTLKIKLIKELCSKFKVNYQKNDGSFDDSFKEYVKEQ